MGLEQVRPVTGSGIEPEQRAADPAATEVPDTKGAWSRRLRRPSVWLALVFLIAVAVWWFGFRSEGTSSTTTATTTQQLVTVTRGTMSNTVSAEGTVQAAQTDNLSFSSAGTVTAVNVRAGDTVTTGQVLATIDSSQLQASVTNAEASVANAQAKLSDDETAGASSAQITADQTNLASANDNLTSAQQALAGASLVATFDGTVSQVNITVGQQLANGGVGSTTATGTGSGSGRSSASIGSSGNSFGGGGNGSSSAASGTSSTPQIQVVSRGSYTVSLPVSSNDIANVASGQGVTVTVTTSSANGFPGGFGGGRFGGFGGLFGRQAAGGANATAGNGNTNRANGTATGATATGTVSDVAKVATATSGVATYPVTVAFTAPANNFYIGATVTGAIATNVRQNVLQVPVLAVTTANGTSTVTVATKGTLSGPKVTRTVKTGATANGMVEITEGLKEGDSVVVTVPSFAIGSRGSGTTGGLPTGGFRGGFGGAGTNARNTATGAGD